MMDLIAIGKALDEFSGFLDVRLEKANRAQRAHAAFQRTMRIAERKFRRLVAEYFTLIDREVKRNLPRMRVSSPSGMVDSLADWNEIEAEGTALFKPGLLAMLTAGGESVMGQRLVQKQRFDPINEAAVAWSERTAAALVVEITTKTREGIQAIIAIGLAEGEALFPIARAIRPTIGLTERYALAVARNHAKMLEAGIDAVKAAKRTERYTNKLLRSRANTIARTETADALNEGIRQGYGQMGVKQLQRIEDPDCCDICTEFNGQIYTLEEAQGVLPEHPNCEGTWVAA